MCVCVFGKPVGPCSIQQTSHQSQPLLTQEGLTGHKLAPQKQRGEKRPARKSFSSPISTCSFITQCENSHSIEGKGDCVFFPHTITILSHLCIAIKHLPANSPGDTICYFNECHRALVNVSMTLVVFVQKRNILQRG